jgi:hypothetical protein
MSRFRIHMINAEFESTDEAEFVSLESARKAAIVTATRIAGESIANGEHSAAVEVQIREGDHLTVRQVVTLSVSDLIAG